MNNTFCKKLRLILVILFGFISADAQPTRLAWIKGVFRNPAKVGAIAPCSSYVADELTRYIMHEDRKPLRILEVGAGTGPITKEIIKKMNEDDHLDCIELDAVYCDQLEEKFGEHENVHPPGNISQLLC